MSCFFFLLLLLQKPGKELKCAIICTIQFANHRYFLKRQNGEGWSAASRDSGIIIALYTCCVLAILIKAWHHGDQGTSEEGGGVTRLSGASDFPQYKVP